MDFGIVSVAGITVIAYLIGMTCKNVSVIEDKWIPVICGTSGAVLGVVALLIGMPDFPANDIINALAIGIVSGWAATGINQITKQLGGE
jgi:hypothetical protein